MQFGRNVTPLGTTLTNSTFPFRKNKFPTARREIVVIQTADKALQALAMSGS
jgi:hypothetical protein